MYDPSYAPIVRCAKCQHSWEVGSFEYEEGDALECPECGTELVCEGAYLEKSWWWVVKKTKDSDNNARVPKTVVRQRSGES